MLLYLANAGTELVKRSIEEMAATKADEVVLEAEVTNKGALALYRNLGFLRDKRLLRFVSSLTLLQCILTASCVSRGHSFWACAPLSTIQYILGLWCGPQAEPLRHAAEPHVALCTGYGYRNADCMYVLTCLLYAAEIKETRTRLLHTAKAPGQNPNRWRGWVQVLLERCRCVPAEAAPAVGRGPCRECSCSGACRARDYSGAWHPSALPVAVLELYYQGVQGALQQHILVSARLACIQVT